MRIKLRLSRITVLHYNVAKHQSTVFSVHTEPDDNPVGQDQSPSKSHVVCFVWGFLCFFCVKFFCVLVCLFVCCLFCCCWGFFVGGGVSGWVDFFGGFLFFHIFMIFM